MEETRKLIICRGIQGSGKTTWAKQWCHEDPEHRVRFNNDDIRNTLGDYWIPSREKLVKALYEEFLSYSMAHGYDIVIDNMNLNLRTTSAIVEEVNLFNRIAQGKYEWKYVVEFKDFWTPVEECIRRDASRPNPIGEKVIKDTWKRYRNFIIHEDIMAMKAKASQQNENLPIAIICDMDATLCLNTSGRPFYGEGAAEGMEKDEPVNEIISLVRAYCNFHNAELIILTGREDTPESRAATEKWLDAHFLYPNTLLMRPKGDYSAGPDCKKKLYEQYIKDKYYIPIVLEDSTKCVRMWREQGLICLQPNEGKF
jgi:predicted kinase